MRYNSAVRIEQCNCSAIRRCDTLPRVLHHRVRSLSFLSLVILLAACSADDAPGAPDTTKPVSPSPTLGGTEPEPDGVVTPVPTSLPRYELTLSEDAHAQLEAAPWDAEDVAGSFEDENGHAYTVELNYRGAYALQNLIASGTETRNWKVKFSKEDPLLGRREWNFNRETHLRHKLAYDLMQGAGVRVPSAEYVLLTVNGEDFGMYLRYEDPDNKAWVEERFGSDAGDLFKAAYDVPNQPKRFALLTVLGTADEDYFLHYNKKLNNEDAAATDFGHLRTFIDELNGTSDDALPAWLESHFDVASFTSYLVIANFMSHWDSYPQRPKNYWLYQSPRSGHWFYVPWDMDATFQTEPNGLAPMGPEASIFHSFDQFEAARPNSAEEGTERPLVRRMMAVPAFRQAYVERYRELSQSLLTEAFFNDRIDALTELCEAHVSADDLDEVRRQNDDIRAYVERRVVSVRQQLEDAP